MNKTQDRFRGCLLGLAIGDALGTTLEFQPRGHFMPITDMQGGGPFGLCAGEWTDDTSMAMCLASSLLDCGHFDAHDQMQRYCRWRDEGYWSCTGQCFDIGNTVNHALNAYQRHGNAYAGSNDLWMAGNGSLMRLAPIPLFYFSDTDAAEHFAGESSKTTHGAAECVDACRLFARQLIRALAGQDKSSVLWGDAKRFKGAPKIQQLADDDYRDKDESAIRGSGYVVESFQAALWSFATTDNFADAVLRAANLGDDADTTAAICGQIAGAYYGLEAIPDHWQKCLAMREDIKRIADRLYLASQSRRAESY